VHLDRGAVKRSRLGGVYSWDGRQDVKFGENDGGKFARDGQFNGWEGE